MDEVLATCRSACARLDAHPDLVFARGEAWAYDVVERTDPELFARIRAHIAAGRWEVVGGWWVQPECNLPTAHGLRRQIEAGRDYFEPVRPVPAHGVQRRLLRPRGRPARPDARPGSGPLRDDAPAGARDGAAGAALPLARRGGRARGHHLPHRPRIRHPRGHRGAGAGRAGGAAGRGRAHHVLRRPGRPRRRANRAPDRLVPRPCRRLRGARLAFSSPARFFERSRPKSRPCPWSPASCSPTRSAAIR